MRQGVQTKDTLQWWWPLTRCWPPVLGTLLPELVIPLHSQSRLKRLIIIIAMCLWFGLLASYRLRALVGELGTWANSWKVIFFRRKPARLSTRGSQSLLDQCSTDSEWCQEKGVEGWLKELLKRSTLLKKVDAWQKYATWVCLRENLTSNRFAYALQGIRTSQQFPLKNTQWPVPPNPPSWRVVGALNKSSDDCRINFSEFRIQNSSPPLLSCLWLW